MNGRPPSPAWRLERRGSQSRREIDRLIGVPLLLVLGLIRRQRSLPTKISSIGIIGCSTIGDTIITSAVARDIKAALPKCHIVLFASSSARGVSSLVEGFDEEVWLPITRPLTAVHVIRARRLDLLIDVAAWPRMVALVTALARTGCTLGFRTLGQHRHYAYDVSVPHSASRHELDNVRALIAPLGIRGTLLPRARAELRDSAKSAGDGSKQAILHPWASGFRAGMREWPTARWTELARNLIADGFHVTITGGPSDRDRSERLAQIIDRPGRVRVLAGKASLAEAAAEIAAAAIVIAVNTGTMHLAAALGKKLVALHGPTDPARWGPLNEQAIVIGPGREAGGAYLNLGFEYPKDAPDCMAKIEVDEVIAATRALTSSEHRDSRAFNQQCAHESAIPTSPLGPGRTSTAEGFAARRMSENNE